MADEEKSKEDQVIDLVQKTGGLIGEPMSHDGFPTPNKGWMALHFLHQVRIKWLTENGQLNPQITLELYEPESVGEDQVPALDKDFLSYAKEGKCRLKKRGMVQFVTSADTANPRWADTFRLTPTVPRGMWEDPAAAKSRLESISSVIRGSRYKRLELRWKKVLQALSTKTPDLTPDKSHGRYAANFYQRHESSEGTELWVGRLPSDYANLPVKDGMAVVTPEGNGVTVCLTTEFLESLKFVVQEVTLKHMAFLVDAYIY
ncbi:MAG: hypothetical protein WCK01_01205 [Candidatus Uhrbacteria bacterium]